MLLAGVVGNLYPLEVGCRLGTRNVLRHRETIDTLPAFELLGTRGIEDILRGLGRSQARQAHKANQDRCSCDRHDSTLIFFSYR